jgi:3alpha(or 20beta)-hydroxysteroid dehydrogenase
MGLGRLAGKVILISGAARGQGEAEAKLFAEEGARLVIGDVLDDAGREVAGALGSDVHYVPLDVTRAADWRAVAERALAEFGRIDGLVNNAGIHESKSIADSSQADFERILSVNLTGAFLGIQAVMGPMQASGGGSIVNTSSISGFGATHGQAAYSSSKFGLRGLTKAAAIELGPQGIRVNSIHPGMIDTPMNQAPDLQDVDFDGLAGALPIPRQGTAEEIARLALFLCSDDSTYSTGSEFTADGGFTASP